jgi:creatinine amidohydrolase
LAHWIVEELDVVNSVFIAEINSVEFARRVQENPIVFLPVGATEQHGPHMGLGVDVFLPNAVCERVAREAGGLIAPAIPYGYKSQARSGGGETFPGTISLDMNTLILTIGDVLHALGSHGIRRLVVAVGHFENVWPAIEGIDLALRELQRDGISNVTILRLEYWNFIRKETLDRLFPDVFPGTEFEHAGLLETSLALSVKPDLVDMSKVPTDGPARFPHFDRYPKASGYVPPSGVLARADHASAEKGEWLLRDHVELITKAGVEAFAA